MGERSQGSRPGTTGKPNGRLRPPGGSTSTTCSYPSASATPRSCRLFVFRSVKLVWSAARPELAFTFVLQAVSSLALAAEVLLARLLLSAILLVNRGGSINHIVLPLVALTVAAAFIAFTGTAGYELQRILSELVQRYATGKVLDVAVAADLLAFETPSFHDRLQRAQMNGTVHSLQMTTGLINVARSFFAVAGVGAALILIQPLFLALLVAAYIPVWFATTRASKVSYKRFVEITEKDRRHNYLQMVPTYKEEAKEIRAFDLGGFFRSRWDDLYQWRIDKLRRLMRTRLALGLAGSAAMSVLTAGAVGFLVWLVSARRISLAGAGAAAGALLLLGGQLQSLTNGTAQLFDSSLFIEDFNSFLRSMPLMVAHGRGGRGTPPERFQLLRAEAVTFTYPCRETPSLLGASMEIRSGEVVALVGDNGSGKTTLAKVLAGLYRPDAGRVLWDGTDSASFDPHLWRDRVTVLFQDYVHYFLSARENIGAGRWRGLDDIAGIKEASVRAGVDDFLSGLEKGYESLLGPEFLGGVDVSGGQWQRIALARAFFRNAPFIILDEPTVALDPEPRPNCSRTYEAFSKDERPFLSRTGSRASEAPTAFTSCLKAGWWKAATTTSSCTWAGFMRSRSLCRQRPTWGRLVRCKGLHRAALVVASCYPAARALEAGFSVERSEMAVVLLWVPRPTCCEGSS
jgi:ATP-binding cassette subfamily B protein